MTKTFFTKLYEPKHVISIFNFQTVFSLEISEHSCFMLGWLRYVSKPFFYNICSLVCQILLYRKLLPVRLGCIWFRESVKKYIYNGMLVTVRASFGLRRSRGKMYNILSSFWKDLRQILKTTTNTGWYIIQYYVRTLSDKCLEGLKHWRIGRVFMLMSLYFSVLYP